MNNVGLNNYDLTRLTAAERLYLWRHRQRSTTRSRSRMCNVDRPGAPMTRAEAAITFGLTFYTYTQLEEGHRTELDADDCANLAAAMFSVIPTTTELCIIARRRSKLTLREVCAELVVSVPFWHEMERLADPLIVIFWSDRGFRFR